MMQAWSLRPGAVSGDRVFGYSKRSKPNNNYKID
jgi:hypothetical protein